jgi:hypothetical protein
MASEPTVPNETDDQVVIDVNGHPTTMSRTDARALRWRESESARRNARG